MTETGLLFLAALLIGFLVGLTGVGGGALMTPTLILGFGVNPVTAIATDLVFATLTKLSTVPVHNKQKSIDWKSARMVWAGSIPGVVIGLFLVIFFLQQSLTALTIILAAVLVLTSFSMFISFDLDLSETSRRQLSVFGGGFIGVSVATTSVGAGALGMAIFRALMPQRAARELVGTDIAHSIPLALIGGIAYLSTGLIDFQLLAVMLLGSLPGALAGARYSSKVSTVLLRRILGVVLLAAAVGVALKAGGVI